MIDDWRPLPRSHSPGPFVDSRGWRGSTPVYSPGRVSGSGSARLDLSPERRSASFGERIAFCWSKVADARKRPDRERPRCLEIRASRVPGAKGVLP